MCSLTISTNPCATSPPVLKITQYALGSLPSKASVKHPFRLLLMNVKQGGHSSPSKTSPAAFPKNSSIKNFLKLLQSPAHWIHSENGTCCLSITQKSSNLRKRVEIHNEDRAICSQTPMRASSKQPS